MNLMLGDCLERMKEIPDNSVDSIVTDPPYGLSFMGKKWDYDVPSTDIWTEALRVLKPGGHLLSFGGTRTYHRMVVNIEDAGFEIRDQIMWIYGSGFPKSTDVSKRIDKEAGAEREIVGKKSTYREPQSPNGWDCTKRAEFETAPSTPEAIQWQGWGTALKPANEPIVVARKPLSESTVAQNVLKWGTGALNIDRSRIGLQTGDQKGQGGPNANMSGSEFFGQMKTSGNNRDGQGRWPANIIFDEEAAKALDEQSGNLKSGKLSPHHKIKAHDGFEGKSFKMPDRTRNQEFGNDSGGASRFFYVAKSSKSERNLNCSGVLSWENVDLSQLMDELNLLLKDISEDTMLLLKDSSWSTDLFGHSISETYPMGLMFTISTALKLITELKTLNSSQNLSTSASILDAIRMIEESGLSLAESVANIKTLDLTTTREETASLLGVSLALLQMLSKIRDCAKQGNVHSTVKPLKLGTYLQNLVTPPGGVTLDPFMGSGSFGVSAKAAGFKFIGIERDPQYFEIAKKRIESAGPIVEEEQDQLEFPA